VLSRAAGQILLEARAVRVRLRTWSHVTSGEDFARHFASYRAKRARLVTVPLDSLVETATATLRRAELALSFVEACQLGEGEIAQIASLRNEIVKRYQGLEMPPEDAITTYRKHMQTLDSCGATSVVAVIKSGRQRIVGYAAYVSNEMCPAIVVHTETAVAPEARWSGVAEVLIDSRRAICSCLTGSTHLRYRCLQRSQEYVPETPCGSVGRGVTHVESEWLCDSRDLLTRRPVLRASIPG